MIDNINKLSKTLDSTKSQPTAASIVNLTDEGKIKKERTRLSSSTSPFLIRNAKKERARERERIQSGLVIKREFFIIYVFLFL